MAPNKSDDVVYIGGATVRRITKKNWEVTGITNQDEVVWSRSMNDNRIKVGDLTQEALDFLLLNHGREFVIASEGKPADLPVDKPNPDLRAPGDGLNRPK